MPTVIFDFDSTIISSESLDEILIEKADNDQNLLNQIHELTIEGIEGAIVFSDSIRKRLSLIKIHKNDIIDYSKRALHKITPGMRELIQSLQNQNVEIYVISGAIRETLLEVTQKLKIPDDHVFGVSIHWDKNGNFINVNPADPFSYSKVKGVSSSRMKWRHPSVMVGDAVSDYSLYEQGLVDHMIQYTQHYNCLSLSDKNLPTASNTTELKRHLGDIFHEHEVTL